MIEMVNVSKAYPTRHGDALVLKNVSMTLQRGERIAIIGGNGAGKSTFIRLISGIEPPTSGTVRTDMQISWPLAFSGAFQGTMTGLDNMRFICRVYGKDWHEAVDFVEDFSQLGRYLKEPLKTYSSGMRARLAFAISMMIEFDCYLLDEVFAVGDARFRQRCQDELFVKRADRAFVIVSHDARFLFEHCERGSVLYKGELTHYENLEAAQTAHDLIMKS